MLKLSGMGVSSAALGALAQQAAPADYTLEIAPYEVEVASRRTVKTIAYKRQVPGSLLRLKEGRPVTIDVSNQTSDSEVVHSKPFSGATSIGRNPRWWTDPSVSFQATLRWEFVS
jgi:FtsP/CotA-like multicopper oxidase with cupredoxin domain